MSHKGAEFLTSFITSLLLKTNIIIWISFFLTFRYGAFSLCDQNGQLIVCKVTPGRKYWSINQILGKVSNWNSLFYSHTYTLTVNFKKSNILLASYFFTYRIIQYDQLLWNRDSLHLIWGIQDIYVRYYKLP